MEFLFEDFISFFDARIIPISIEGFTRDSSPMILINDLVIFELSITEADNVSVFIFIEIMIAVVAACQRDLFCIYIQS